MSSMSCSPTGRAGRLDRCRRGRARLALWAVFTVLALVAAGCGGGGSGSGSAGAIPPTTGTHDAASATIPVDGTNVPAGAPTSPLTEAPALQPADAETGAATPDGIGSQTPSSTAAKIDRVLLGQVMVYPAEDPELVLVGSKDTLVVARLTTDDPAEGKPTGIVRVTDAAGRVVQESPLDLPTRALPSVTPEALDLDSIYSATIPGQNVQPGMQIDIRLAGGQLSRTIKPRVGAPNGIKLVMVPVRVSAGAGDAVGQVQSRGGELLRLRAPVASVDVQLHPPLVSASAPGDSAAVLAEISQLRALEQPDRQTYYYGFVPTQLFPRLGGLAYLRGRAAVSIEDDAHVAHEIAHNIGLRHAPCGGATDVDPHYPYANAALGAMGRYIWGYLAGLRTFIDPRDTRSHDKMSYCPGDTFSDYNYRLMQRLLDPASASAVDAAAEEPAPQAPRELLLIAGSIRGTQVELAPVKRFEGRPGGTGGQAYLLRLETTSGVVEYPFDTEELDHDSETRLFTLSIPAPGSVRRLQIFQRKQMIYERVAVPGSSVAAQQTRQKTSTPPVQLFEQNGEARVSWDAGSYPYLTVVHVGAQRTVLMQDMRDRQAASATLPLSGLPAGGDFELILSDGLNTARIVQAR
ncbi:MAG: zinc-dependent metalloprotease [Gammaproteobacteria bacterium]|nr:zinc-dependent metalloprotease [Gammaproteobacteria bacterium]MBU1443498.1 zinc-dependent metalloprotease [Gammaproteobacteria bacterium]MBU2409042.1 zinc-dependent metalloprotease [Gammaproteobacteria bacterium]